MASRPVFDQTTGHHSLAECSKVDTQNMPSRFPKLCNEDSTNERVTSEATITGRALLGSRWSPETEVLLLQMLFSVYLR